MARGGARPGAGRKKGVPTKMTLAAKEAIQYAFLGLGGADRLVAWAQEDKLNERSFWTQIYPKLLPLQVTGDPANPLAIQAVEWRVIDPAQ